MAKKPTIGKAKKVRKATKSRAPSGGGARPVKETARRGEYADAWTAVVLALFEVRDRAEVLAVPSVGRFVDELLYIVQTIGQESPPDSSFDDLARRLARGFPTAESRKREAETPRGKAEAWVRRQWMGLGPKCKSRIAFAVWALPWIDELFDSPVDPQKTIVERWIKDLP